MAMPSSGEIKLFQAGKEVVVGAREAAIPDSTVLLNFPNGISLKEISTGTGAAADDPINLANPAANRPDGLSPHALSEFYSYDDDYTIASGHYTVWTRTAGSSSSTNYLYTDPSHSTNTDPIVNPLGTATTSKWRKGSFDLSPYRNALIRLKIGFLHGTTSFRCDTGLTSWYIETQSDDMLDGYNRYSNFSGDYAAGNPRDIVDQSDLYIATGDSMDRQSGTSSTSYSSTSGWTAFSHSGSNLTAYELNSATDGTWNFRTIYGPTASSNTGPDNVYFAYQNVINGQVQNEYYDYQDLDSSFQNLYLPYLYYEASNQSSADWSWMRTIPFYVPNDAETLHFIYTAWSNDQTNWYNSQLKIIVEVD